MPHDMPRTQASAFQPIPTPAPLELRDSGLDGAYAVSAGSVPDQNEQLWTQLAVLHPARLDAGASVLLNGALPARPPGRIAAPKFKVEAPLRGAFAELQRDVSIDSVRNSYQLRSRVHRDLSRTWTSVDIDNEIVYRELFLSPLNDPWFGLNTGASTGLDNDGILNGIPSATPEPVPMPEPTALQTAQARGANPFGAREIPAGITPDASLEIDPFDAD